jgi:hypothetical protein
LAYSGAWTATASLNKIQPYIDSRVADHAGAIEEKARLNAEESESFDHALAFANSANYRDALPLIYKSYKDVSGENPKWKVTDLVKDDVYAYMIWILSQLDVEQKGGWMGQFEWSDLSGDKYFQKDFLSAPWLKSDDLTNSYLAICVLKFDRSPQAVEDAQSIYITADKASNASNLEVKSAPKLFALAMIDLINNNEDSALYNIKNAGNKDPFTYSSDIASYIKSYKHGYRVSSF